MAFTRVTENVYVVIESPCICRGSLWSKAAGRSDCEPRSRWRWEHRTSAPVRRQRQL